MKWYIDFSGYCEIEANSAEEAEAKFWKGLRTPCEDAFNDVWDIDSIERADVPQIKTFIPGVTNLDELFPLEAKEGD